MVKVEPPYWKRSGEGSKAPIDQVLLRVPAPPRIYQQFIQDFKLPK